MKPVLFGIDQLLAEPKGLGGRLGLVTNAAALTAAPPQRPSRLALQQAGFNLVRLFSPEHGLQADAPDGAAVSNSRDALTGLPVSSLYGARLKPALEELADLDAVLFDIPDIGARFYTYTWTLFHTLEACAQAAKPLVVLERPNPLGGQLEQAEGPLLDVEQCASFLGRASIPIRHSLTLGELARLWNAEGRLGAELRVVPCAGWRRSMQWPQNGLSFVPTSPAMRSYESALLYPGVCLFEASNLSVGRGTERAFQLVGAPWLEADAVAAQFNALGLAGLRAKAQEFRPTQAPFAGELCQGIRLELLEPAQVRPVAAGLHLLAGVLARQPKRFQWATYPTAANPSGQGHFERLIGRGGVREVLEQQPKELAERIGQWTAVPSWAERVAGCLLYE